MEERQQLILTDSAAPRKKRTSRWRIFASLMAVSLVAAGALVANKREVFTNASNSLVARAESLEWDTVGDALSDVRVEGDSLFSHEATLTSYKRIRFGQSVAVSGNIAVIGAPKALPTRDGSGNRMYKGAVFVLRRVGGKWRRTQTLRVNSGWEFGYKVALSQRGRILAVSSIQEDAVHVFMMVRGRFRCVQKVGPKKTNRLNWTGYGSSFGSSVTLSREYLVVGARHETINALYYFGGVFIYKLCPKKNKFVLMQRYLSNFGPGHFDVVTSMSPSRPNLLVVGSMANFGKVRIMKLNKKKGKFEVVKFIRNKMRVFGSSVSLDGKVLAVGAYEPQLNTAGVNNPGFVFVYEECTPNNWKLVAKLTKGQKGKGFGTSVKVTGGQVVVGAPKASKKYGDQRGAVFVYKKQGKSLKCVQSIYSRRNQRLGFGKSVDVCGKTLIAGGYASRGKGIAAIYS